MTPELPQDTQAVAPPPPPPPPPPAHKGIYVETIKPDTGIAVDYFQVAEISRKEKKDGSAYLSLVLADRTGRVDAKLWDIPPGLNLQAGAFVKVQYEPITYRDSLQLKVAKIRVLDRGDIYIEDYIPASKNDRDDMLRHLESWIGEIDSAPLRDVLLVMLADLRPMLRDAPAAKSKHQAYLGGLLEHILRLLRLAESVHMVYTELDRDVLYAAAIVHDIGKIYELQYQDRIDYTRAGSLIGHIVQGSVLWDRRSGNLEPRIREHVAHIIVSHHGTKEWGSPQIPMTREAQIFHFLDMIDSRYEMMTGTLAKGVNADGLTEFDRGMGCALWDGK